MISTTEYKDIQATVIHRITDEISTEEVKVGVDELVETLNNAVRKYGSINFIINAKGMTFSSLIAHKTWHLALDNSMHLKEKIRYCALVFDDSPNARAEKKFMENERLKFFFDFDEAVNWLSSKIGV
jgi:hypothetical protein